jgi:hypothetical protein
MNVIVSVEVLQNNVPGGTEDDHENRLLVWMVSGRRFEPKPFSNMNKC